MAYEWCGEEGGRAEEGGHGEDGGGESVAIVSEVRSLSRSRVQSPSHTFL